MDDPSLPPPDPPLPEAQQLTGDIGMALATSEEEVKPQEIPEQVLPVLPAAAAAAPMDVDVVAEVMATTASENLVTEALPSFEQPKPPLGRFSSTGDSQLPVLGERQTSSASNVLADVQPMEVDEPVAQVTAPDSAVAPDIMLPAPVVENMNMVDASCDGMLPPAPQEPAPFVEVEQAVSMDPPAEQHEPPAPPAFASVHTEVEQPSDGALLVANEQAQTQDQDQQTPVEKEQHEVAASVLGFGTQIERSEETGVKQDSPPKPSIPVPPGVNTTSADTFADGGMSESPEVATAANDDNNETQTKETDVQQPAVDQNGDQNGAEHMVGPSTESTAETVTAHVPPTMPPSSEEPQSIPAPPPPGPEQLPLPGPPVAEDAAVDQPGLEAQDPPPPPPPPKGGMRELRVEDALLYLDDVKRVFGDRPRVYNEFLAIMKNFKSQEVDTPGVIARVSRLFRGFNDLILGFNKFLPDGFKISMEDLEVQERDWEREEAEAARAAAEATHGHALPPPAAGLGGQNPPREAYVQGGAASQQASLGAQTAQPSPPQPANGGGRAPARDAASQPPTVEFDHAISYVTTIKRRFANDPNTYHSFLDILHTYQKEQRGIKEVLEQVAFLFQEHPDLLKAFTFFLPDAVQEQAKERLNRAAAESESRIAAQRAKRDQSNDRDSEYGQGKFIDISMTEADSSRGRKRSKQSLDSQSSIQLPQQPENYCYNAAVERQFFDAAREALASYTRDGGQAWSEFQRCLDMYVQEILSRNEMLNFVEPLLGEPDSKLFKEFKRIIASAGAQSGNQPNVEDSWFSVPLSEIDFSRCRRCSPSYRALPRDYPAPPCSERSVGEAHVLNDIWVSLPVGSEESYTFRHMRRNACEEVLFRCEDERFEIDMIIDSNAVTLALLDPIAEEIAQLAENELVIPENNNVPKPANRDQGLAGKKFQYTFDKCILKVIHRNSIARIYGDAGQEMVDLISTNPTVAIPLVVDRLRQKDKEWKAVRARLNRKWKELAEQNYYKSLDHRSLTWRTTDKRAISTRTLISEIKDREVNNGNEGAATFQARLDKAKEEHGTFYEVTMGEAIKKQLDLTNLPKPDRRLFTPHMSLLQENTDWVHRDGFRILSFALERGSISPADKERCHRLWLDFLGPMFKLSMDWMMTPATGFQESGKLLLPKEHTHVVSNGEESPEDDDDSLGAATKTRMVTEDVRALGSRDKDTKPSSIDHHPLPKGSTVSTIYGEGTVLGCRQTDDTYIIQIPFGLAYLRPSSILCSIMAAEKSTYTSQLRNEDRTKLERPGDSMAIGTQSLYLFFRLNHIFLRRLGVAKELAYNVKDDGSLINMVEHMSGTEKCALGRRRYDAYLNLLFSLLDGGVSGSDGGKYEDRVRSLLGHGGYALATMDKLISHILKNLQTMANDDTMWNLVQLFRRHLDAGSFKPEAFRQEAAFLSDGEAMYAFQLCPVRKEGQNKSVMHIECLGVIADSEEEPSAAEPAIVEPVVKRQKRER